MDYLILIGELGIFATIGALYYWSKGIKSQVESIGKEQGKIEAQLNKLDDIKKIHEELKKIERISQKMLEIDKTQLSIHEKIVDIKLKIAEKLINKLVSCLLLFSDSIYFTRLRKEGNESQSNKIENNLDVMKFENKFLKELSSLWELLFSNLHYIEQENLMMCRQIYISLSEGFRKFSADASEDEIRKYFHNGSNMLVKLSNALRKSYGLDALPENIGDIMLEKLSGKNIDL